MRLTFRRVLAILIAASAVVPLTAPGQEEALEIEEVESIDEAFAGVQVRNGEVRVFATAGGPAPLSPADVAPVGNLLRPGQRLITSENKQHTGIVEYRPSANGGPESVFSRLGANQILWTRVAEGLASYSISDDGSTVVEAHHDIHAPDAGRLVLLDDKGSEVMKREVPGLRAVRVTPDGGTLAASTLSGEILVLDRQGDSRAHIASTGDFRISRDGSRVLALEDQRAAVYRGATLEFALPTSGIATDAVFSDDGDVILVADRLALQVRDLETGMTITQAASRPGLEFSSVAVTLNGGFLASAFDVVRPAMRNEDGEATAEIVVLDATGRLRDSETIELTDWQGAIPELSLLPDGTTALVTTSNAIHMLKIDLTGGPNDG